MTFREMMELLKQVKLEHPMFNLDNEDGRFDAWYRKYQKLTAAQFARLCDEVIDSCKFTPGRADFKKAYKDIFGDAKDTGVKLDPKFAKDYDAYTTRKGLTKKHDGSTYRYERTGELEVIEKAFGHAWYNAQLKIKSAEDCLALCRHLSADRSLNARYIGWRAKAAEQARLKLSGLEYSAPNFEGRK